MLWGESERMQRVLEWMNGELQQNLFTFEKQPAMLMHNFLYQSYTFMHVNKILLAAEQSLLISII